MSTLIANTATKLRTSLRNKERLVSDIFGWSVHGRSTRMTLTHIPYQNLMAQ